ncbi:TPA: potassium channel protein [Candidatus Sumerlaeota bacterium]|nr:potassium channel protein [Candidatus Sumerlaeota bacterium]
MSLINFARRNTWQLSIALFIMVACVGVMGYRILAHLSFIDALYMTINTLTTTGFDDLASKASTPANAAAIKLFTICLLLFGATIVTFAISMFLRSLIEGELRHAIGRHTVKRRVRFMKDHYIICGCGRMGEIIADAMQRDHIPFVVIENDPDKRIELQEHDIPCVLGDATSDEVLLEAAIEKAKGLITVTHADPENLFITMSARQLNPNLMIVSRALTAEGERKMLRAGANRVILPYMLGAHQIAQAALRPNVVDFIEIATRTSKLDVEIEELQVGDRSPITNKALRDVPMLRDLGLIVIGVRPAADDNMLFNPSASTVIKSGDTLIVLGKPDSLKKIRTHLG